MLVDSGAGGGGCVVGGEIHRRSCFFLFYFVNSEPRIWFIDFRERQRGKEERRERESPENIDVRGMY